MLKNTPLPMINRVPASDKFLDEFAVYLNLKLLFRITSSRTSAFKLKKGP